MEATMLTIDRLVDGINGEDPAGARTYMSELRENETLSMLESFEDMLSGRLPVAPPPSRGRAVPLSGSSGGSMAYRVPPNEFLRVLVEGNTTRLGALHAVLQAIGRGDLQGRAASLCISEVRLCLASCTNSTGVANGDGQSAPLLHRRRIPVAQLRELAGVCLSFSMDTPAAVGAKTDSHPPGVYAGGRRGSEDANNRRVLMLEALPVILESCLAAALAEEENGPESGGEDDDDEDEDDESGAMKGGSESDRDVVEDGLYAEAEAETRGTLAGGKRSVAAGAADGGRKRKGKGKSAGKGENARCHSIIGDHTGYSVERCVRPWPCRSDVHQSNGNGHDGWRHGRLPQQGEAILRDVTDALLDRPWPLRLALPLLGVFEEIFGLVELLDCRGTGAVQGARKEPSGKPARQENLWTRVRWRLMEVVRTGSLDGADFTGLIRQVCVLCDIDSRWENQRNCRRVPLPLVGSISQQCEAEENTGEGVHVVSTRASRPGSWISCLRQLYAAVPPEWVSTVELVLEQTLHQMPGVIESLLDAIQDAGSNMRGGVDEWGAIADNGTVLSRVKRQRSDDRSTSSSPSSAVQGSTFTSIGSDLALLIILLREASPLRACSLPLLPFAVDRGRRAEEAIRHLFLEATHCDVGVEERGETGSNGKDETPERRRYEGGLGGARSLVQEILCSENSSLGAGSGSGARDQRGRGCSSRVGVNSGVVSERASQLLDLALQWIEEGNGVNDSGGDASKAIWSKGMDSAAEISVQDIASDMMSAMFDTVVEARPRLLKALLCGVFDQNQGGMACAWSYLRAWEALMSQEAELKCRRLTPYSQAVSDALGRLTLLPADRGRRVVESLLPLADVCPTQASALVNLCRKCSVQGDSKGRLLTVHTVTCILVWNACRVESRQNGGFLEQEGMQEDLVGMFRRAFEGGLQTAARADALDLLASKLATPTVDRVGGSATSNCTTTGVATDTRRNEDLVQAARGEEAVRAPPRLPFDRKSPPVIDLTALTSLREYFVTRLFRFFAPKDEVLDLDANDVVPTDRQLSGGRPGGVRRGKQKGKQKARQRRGGRFVLVPLRLLEERMMTSSTGHALVEQSSSSGGSFKGRGPVGSARGRKVVARDPVGQLLKCCWALVPAIGESVKAGSLDDSHGSLKAGQGKRAEVEAIARAMLGAGRQKSGFGEGAGTGSLLKSDRGTWTQEAEALMAVVEFLQEGGGMETVRTISTSHRQAPDHPEDSDGVTQAPASAPPACHPGVVSLLTALGVVVTLAESLVDCLLSGLACPPATPAVPFSRPNPPRKAKVGKCLQPRHTLSSGGTETQERQNHQSFLVLWAVTDAFTLLAASTRMGDGVAGPAGFYSNKQAKARTPQGLSDMIVSLPAETLALSGGPQLNGMAEGLGGDSDDDGGGGIGRGGGGKAARRTEADTPGPRALLSAASALAFAEEFLAWAATEKGTSPAALVAGGWDGGIGVWLGLSHSVQTLVKALKTRGGTAAVGDHRGDVCSKARFTSDNGPSAEAIAHVVFQLRGVVGAPSAARDVLYRSPPATEIPSFCDRHSPCAPSASSVDGRICPCPFPAADHIAHDSDRSGLSRSSRRPPPGTMIEGFLEKMSERWKAALPWGLPGATAPTRASPRLERYRRSCRADKSTGSLKAEAEDLLFALRCELLRAERVVLSNLLVGPNATRAEREWTVRAALTSARRRQNENSADRTEPKGLSSPSLSVAAPGAPRVHTSGGDETVLASPTSEEPPETGSGPARAASKAYDVEKSTLTKATATAGGKRGRVPPAHDEGLEPGLGVGKDAGRNGPSGGPAAAVRDTEQEVERDGLGALCRLAALEMRDGLEDGLSVKLSLAYLDLIELLGNAALEHRREPPKTYTTCTTSTSAGLLGTRTSKESRVASGNQSRQTSGDLRSSNSVAIRSGREADDAGCVLLSITTCHVVHQGKIFKRLIDGAVRFGGVGVNHGIHRAQAPSTVAITLADLQARNRDTSRVVEGPNGSRGGGEEKEINTRRGILPLSPPLRRSSRLVVHCVQWIRAYHGNKRRRTATTLFEDEGGESSEEEVLRARSSANGDGKYDDGRLNRDPNMRLHDTQEDDDPPANDASQSRYSFRPEDVKFASSRECFVAMRAALLECETALSSAGGTASSGGGGLDTRGGGIYRDANLADVLATVAFGLREVLAPTVMTRTTAHATKHDSARREGKGITHRSAAATNAVAHPAQTSTPAVQPPEHKPIDLKPKNADAVGGSPLAALGMFPENIKLLLMRVLERICLVGKVATVGASTVLDKPSSVATATVSVVPELSASSLPPRALPPPPSCPSTPTSKRIRQHCVSVANAGKPGDQAGGAPVKAPTKCGERITDGDGAGSWITEKTASAAVPVALTAGRCTLRSTRSRTVSSNATFQGGGTKPGGGGMGTGTRSPARSKVSKLGPNIESSVTLEEDVNPLLPPVLPAVTLASGDCLQLMLAARSWAEELRSKGRAGGDDLCRKRASSLLFKIERFELDIAAAAQKARQFLQNFEGEDAKKNSRAKSETRCAGGIGGANKRPRCYAYSKGNGGGGHGDSKAKTQSEERGTCRCDQPLEVALRLLVSGANTMAVWRRDSAAKERKKTARRNRDGTKGTHTPRGPRGQGAPLEVSEEEDVAKERRGRSSTRDRFGGACGQRRKSRGTRIRSRNAVINGWLQEGGEEGCDREDAFVDLEDFIEA